MPVSSPQFSAHTQPCVFQCEDAEGWSLIKLKAVGHPETSSLLENHSSWNTPCCANKIDSSLHTVFLINKKKSLGKFSYTFVG